MSNYEQWPEVRIRGPRRARSPVGRPPGWQPKRKDKEKTFVETMEQPGTKYRNSENKIMPYEMEEPDVDEIEVVQTKKTKTTKKAESSGNIRSDAKAFLARLPKQPTDNRHVKYLVHEPGKKPDGKSSIVMPTKTSAVKFVAQYMDKYGGMSIQRYSKSVKTGNVSIGHKKREVSDKIPSAYQTFVKNAWERPGFRPDFKKYAEKNGNEKALKKASEQIASEWQKAKAKGQVKNKEPKKSSGSGLTTAEKMAIARKYPDKYMYTNKQGKLVVDTKKALRITKDE